MTEKTKRERLTTPRGTVCGFTAIQKAATNFVPEGKFETQLAFDADAVSDLVEQLEAIRDAELAKIKEKNPKLQKVIKAAPVVSPELDDEGDETGRVILKFGQKRVITTKSGETFTKKIAFRDARGNHITAPVKVGAGSIGKVSFEPFGYYNAKDKVVGVSNRFIGFQLIKLVEYEGGGGPSNADMGFEDETEGDEDAFDASAYTADTSKDDQTSAGGDDGDEEDF